MSSAAWSDPLLRAPNLVCSAQELFPVHAGEPTLCWVLELNWDQVPSTWCLLPAPPWLPSTLSFDRKWPAQGPSMQLRLRVRGAETRAGATEWR